MNGSLWTSWWLNYTKGLWPELVAYNCLLKSVSDWEKMLTVAFFGYHNHGYSRIRVYYV